MTEKAHPWMKWYPSDWRSDLQLRECSIAARGLWAELCGLMHECRPYGHLTGPNGKAKLDEKSAEQCGVKLVVYRKLLAEIEANGVLSRTPDGVIYSRRMVRDRAKADTDRANGKGGGNPRLAEPVNGEVKAEVNGGVNPPDMPEDKAQRLDARSQNKATEGKQQREPRPARARGSRLPADWTLPDEWCRWAMKERAWPAHEAQRVAKQFRDHWLAKGEPRADWFASWRLWVSRERGHANAKHDSRERFGAQVWDKESEEGHERDITGEAKRVA